MIMGSGASARLTIDGSQALATIRALRAELAAANRIKTFGPNLKPLAADARVGTASLKQLNTQMRQSATTGKALGTALKGISTASIKPGAGLSQFAADAGRATLNVRNLRTEIKSMASAARIRVPAFDTMATSAAKAETRVKAVSTEIKAIGRTPVRDVFATFSAGAQRALGAMRPLLSTVKDIGRQALRDTFRALDAGAKTATTASKALLNSLKEIARVTFKSTTTVLTAGLNTAGQAAAKLKSAINGISGKSINVNTAPANASINSTIERVRALRSEMDQASSDFAGAGFGQAAIAAPFLGLTKVGLGAAIDLEQAITNIDVALGGLDTSQLQQLTKDMQTLGINSQYSAVEVSAVAEALAKAGVPLPEIQGMTKAVIDLSQATGTDLTTSTSLLTTVMATYNESLVDSSLAMTDASRAADILTVAANNTKADIAGLEMGMRPAMVTAALLGISFEELAASTAALVDFGMKPADAGLSLTRMLTDLATPTSEATLELERLGIAAFDLEGNFIGIPALFDQLATASKDMTAEQILQTAELLVGAEAADVFAIAMAAGGGPIRDLTALMDQNGIAAFQATSRLDTAKGALERMTEGARTLAGSLMGGLLPAIKTFADGAADLFEWINNLPQPLLHAAGAIIAITGAVIGLNAAMLLKNAAMKRFGADLIGITGKSGLVRGFFKTFAGGLGTIIPLLLRAARLFSVLGLVVTGLTLAYGTNFLGLADFIDGGIAKVKDFIGFFKDGKKAFEDFMSPFTGKGELAGGGLLGNLLGGDTLDDALKGPKDAIQEGQDALGAFLGTGKKTGGLLDKLNASGGALSSTMKDATGATEDFDKTFVSATESINPATKVLFGIGFALEKIGLKRVGKGIQKTAVALEQMGDFVTDLWKGGPRTAMEAYSRLPDKLKPFAKAIGAGTLAVKNLSQAFARGGFQEFARELPKSLQMIGTGIDDAFKEATGRGIVDWTLNVGAPKIAGWLKDAALGTFDILTDLAGWTAGKVMDLAGWTLNVGIPNLVSAVGDLWQWAKEQITGRDGDQTITLGDVMVSIRGYIAGKIADVFTWAKNFIMGSGGVGQEGTTPGDTGGVTIAEMTVNVLGFIGGQLADLGSWVKNDAYPALSGFVLDIPSISINVAGFVAGKIADLWAWLRGQVIGGSTTVNPMSAHGVSVTQGITLDSVGVSIKEWVTGDLWTGLKAAVQRAIDAVTSTDISVKDGVFKMSVDSEDFDVTVDWSGIWDFLNPTFTESDLAKANEIGNKFGVFLGEAIRKGIEMMFSSGGEGGQETKVDPFSQFGVSLVDSPVLAGLDDLIGEFLSGMMDGLGDVIGDAAHDMWASFDNGLAEILGTTEENVRNWGNRIIRIVNAIIVGFNLLPGPDLPEIPEIPEPEPPAFTGFWDSFERGGEIAGQRFKDALMKKQSEIYDEWNKTDTGLPGEANEPAAPLGEPVVDPPVAPGGALPIPQLKQGSGAIASVGALIGGSQGPKGWKQAFEQNLPAIKQSLLNNMGPQFAAPPVNSMKQIGASFQSTLPGLATSALTNFSAARGAGVGQSTLMQTGVLGAMGGMSTGGLGAMAALAGGSTGSAQSMNSGVSGEASTMSGSTLGTIGAMSIGGILQAGLMASGMTSSAGTAREGVHRELAPIPAIVIGVGVSAAGAARSAGASISQGFANGIRSALGEVRAAVGEMAALALQAALLKLQIESPSKVFEKQVGKFIPLGAARGVERNTPAFVRSIEGMASAGIAAASSAKSGLDGIINSLVMFNGDDTPADVVAVILKLRELAETGKYTGAQLKALANELRAFQGDDTPKAIDTQADALDRLAQSMNGVREAAQGASEATREVAKNAKSYTRDRVQVPGGGSVPDTSTGRPPGGGETPGTEEIEDWAKITLTGLKTVASDALKNSGLDVDMSAGTLFNEADWLARVKELGEARAKNIDDLFVGRTRVNDTDFSLMDGKYQEHYGSPVQSTIPVGDTVIVNPTLTPPDYNDLITNVGKVGPLNDSYRNGRRERTLRNGHSSRVQRY